MVVLSEANNVKFSDFVEPGETLVLQAEVVGHDERFTKLKCQGQVGSSVAVRGRLVLERYSLSQTSDSYAVTDAAMTNELEEKFRLLYPAWISETKT